MRNTKLLSQKMVWITVLCLYSQGAGVAHAETTSISPYSQIVDALNRETEGIYEPYRLLVDEIVNTTETDGLLDKFDSNITKWGLVYSETSVVYKQLLNNGDSNVEEIATLALQSNQKGKDSMEMYRQALGTEDQSTQEDLLTKGDAGIQEAVLLHDQAVELYNDYSGVNSSLTVQNTMGSITIVSILCTIFLFMKSRPNSIIEADIVRAGIYKNLAKSALWMTLGLIITTGGLAYAIRNGGSYYIFYGPVIFGGWELLKGLSRYINNDRKILNALAISKKQNAIKNSLRETSVGSLSNPTIQCRACGTEQSKQSIICDSCGENLL